MVQVEGPIHVSEAARRFYTATDITRSSKRVQSAVNEAVDHIFTSGRASRRGGFLWSNDKTQPPVRDRSGLPAATRKLEMVSNEELAEAACMVVGRPYGIA